MILLSSSSWPEAQNLRQSLSALVASYYQTPEFLGLSDSTKRTYRGVIEGLREAHGDKLIADLKKRHVQALLAKKSGTPAAANNLRKRMIQLLDHAIDLDWRRDNPARLVKPYKLAGGGYHTWDEGEISRFLEVHPVGTLARLTVTLILYTGAARVDVVKLGWQNVKGNRIEYRRQKTIRSSGQLVNIPMHGGLVELLADCPRNAMTFLQTAQGASRSPEGLGNLMREWCDGAGLPKCSSHGLRKACARRLAEAGATPHEIMAVTGHKTLAEVERYTRAVVREGLADSAMDKLHSRPNGEQTVVNLTLGFAKNPSKIMKENDK